MDDGGDTGVIGPLCFVDKEPEELVEARSSSEYFSSPTRQETTSTPLTAAMQARSNVEWVKSNSVTLSSR